MGGINWMLHAGSFKYGQNWHQMHPNKDQRWEHGPGVYGTKDYNKTQNYYKGSRALWLIVWDGVHIKDAGNFLRYADAKDCLDVDNFLWNLSPRAGQTLRKELVRWHDNNGVLTPIPKFVFLNLIINSMWDDHTRFPAKNSILLSKFLADHGADWDGDDDVSVVWNPACIKKVIRITPEIHWWDHSVIEGIVHKEAGL